MHRWDYGPADGPHCSKSSRSGHIPGWLVLPAALRVGRPAAATETHIRPQINIEKWVTELPADAVSLP